MTNTKGTNMGDSTAITCRWAGRDRPRTLNGRHNPDCSDDTCRGCQPCTEPHCGVCRRTHADGTCAECLADTRDHLHTIGHLCGALPEEVQHRGINGEAMMLLGPTADPEAWNNRKMSALMGRIAAEYLEDCRDEQHPLWVLGTWEQAWRDHLDHDTDQPLTITTAVSYLDLQMTYMASQEEPPFEDFAHDVRGCRGYLEDVLRDGEREEKGAPCPECGRHLIRRYGDKVKDDRWVCPARSCGESFTDSHYRAFVDDDYLANADALTADDMARRFNTNIPENEPPVVKASQVRVWGTRGLVRKRGRDAHGITLYDVADVEQRLAEKAVA